MKLHAQFHVKLEIFPRTKLPHRLLLGYRVPGMAHTSRSPLCHNDDFFFFFFCFTVNVLKFGTLLSFCSQIKSPISGSGIHKFLVRIANRDCFFRRSLIWICSFCQGLFGRQLVFEILELPSFHK